MNLAGEEADELILSRQANIYTRSLKRRPDGRFKDDDLARIIQDATENRAGAFKARGTPEALRVIEILGIEQGRAWGTCSVCNLGLFLLIFVNFPLLSSTNSEDSWDSSVSSYLAITKSSPKGV